MGEGDTSSVYVSPAQNGDSPQIAYDSLGGQINIAVWCLAAASLVFVVGRLLCKLWRGTRLWWDDWVLMTSWVSFAHFSAHLRRTDPAAS